jgi:hypothetical protein
VTLEEKLSKINVEAYGKKYTVKDLLTKLKEDQIKEIFDDVLESLLQRGFIVQRLVCTEDPHHSYNDEETLKAVAKIRAKHGEVPCPVFGCHGKLVLQEY